MKVNRFNLKSWVVIVILAFLAISFSVVGLAGCNKNKDDGGKTGGVTDGKTEEPEQPQIVGESYGLQEAFDKGYLTKENLETIAYYHNNSIDYPEQLDEVTAQKIKEIAAKELRESKYESFPEAKAEGITIYYFYGSYNGYYVVQYTDMYRSRPTDVPNYWTKIGEVDFHIIGRASFSAFKL